MRLEEKATLLVYTYLKDAFSVFHCVFFVFVKLFGCFSSRLVDFGPAFHGWALLSELFDVVWKGVWAF